MSNINHLFNMMGKRVLVTGASSGLGRHFAQTLARAGARVAVGGAADRSASDVSQGDSL